MGENRRLVQLHRVSQSFVVSYKALGLPPAAELKLGGQSPEEKRKANAVRNALAALEKCDMGERVLSAPEHPLAALLQSGIAAQFAKDGKLEVPYDGDDVADWVANVLVASYRDLRAFVDPPSDQIDEVPNDVRIAVLGDWGSGAYGAVDAARSIRSTTPAYDIAVHLGDIYYTGMEWENWVFGKWHEVQDNFLRLWMEPSPLAPKSYALMGNHEAYSGANGYFDTLLTALGQKSSTFAFRNDHFLFLGIDTGYAHGIDRSIDGLWKDYHDTPPGPALYGSQGNWVTTMIDKYGTNRKVVLFSHHQPFSLFGEVQYGFLDAIRGHLDAQRIAVWYWGHEHRAVLYERHPTWQFVGACIGHGGFPAWRDNFSGFNDPISLPKNHLLYPKGAEGSLPAGLVLDCTDGNTYITDDPTKYGPNGYAAIHARDGHITDQLIAPDGTPLRERDVL